MKPWAESFYESKNWKKTRKAYMLSMMNLCERCGEVAKICHHKIWLTPQNINDVNITLSWDNLEALCQDCHNKEHHKKKSTLRYAFDENGNIISNSETKSDKNKTLF